MRRHSNRLCRRQNICMPEVSMKIYPAQLASFVLLALLASAQDSKAPAVPGAEYSGMYNFLRDGEFVQITVEDKGRVSGFVSRYGDQESDRGAFLDHFFRAGKAK